jgi:neurotransmitter:Na+ symporter, NSS family
MAITGFFVWRGISKGIEWGNRLMMPLLFLMLVLIVIRSLTLPGAMDGVRFLFETDFSKINASTVISALGQVFFSMSVGFGIMLTYASYLGKDTPLSRSSWLIAMSNSLVAVLAGLAILPAVFSFKMEPEQGPGLLFVVIPEIFRQMSGGYVFGILFFLLVLFAALTSSISVLEVPVSYLVDERRLSRRKAVIVASLIVTILGVFCTLSMGSTLGWFKIYGMGIFDLLDFVSNNMLLPVGGLMLCILVGYVWKPEKVLAEITQDGKHPFFGKKYWLPLIRYVVPLAIIAILVSGSGILDIAKSFFE